MTRRTRLTDMARGATEVNLRYTASLLNLSRDYLRALGDTLMNPDAEEGSAAAKHESARGRRGTVALIIAGRRGEIGNAAFSISNVSGKEGSVSVVCRGEFGKASVWPDPERLVLGNGDEAILRVLAKFDDSIPVDEDLRGNVYLPELDKEVAEFVVRRLPDKEKTAPARKRSKKSG
ncbi:MAG TPA: hypothetical protein VE175_05775 [Woeseiaceae bacterium]|nr:hypothetical protein [Woeseiaceae bacterium]